MPRKYFFSISTESRVGCFLFPLHDRFFFMWKNLVKSQGHNDLNFCHTFILVKSMKSMRSKLGFDNPIVETGMGSYYKV